MEKTKSENTLESECKAPQLDLSKPSLLVAKLVGLKDSSYTFTSLWSELLLRQVNAHYTAGLL